jgi:hypothetical protein
MDRVAIIALLFSCLGCTSIDGGAVEASWVVVTKDGRAISDCGCACPPIAKIRLQLLPTADGGSAPDPCAGRAACAFSCNQQSGATRFEIPPGHYSISLVPVGADGNDLTSGSGEAGTCSAAGGASPVVRDVVRGRVTQLDAMVVRADCAADCGGSDSTRVCTK